MRAGTIFAGNMPRWAMRSLIAVPFLLVLVIFVLSNRDTVTIGFWPTDARLDMPLSVALLIAAAIALVVGAFMVWISELRQRRRAHHAEAKVRQLEAQVRELRAQLHSSAAPPGN
jgi:lipopolysaccharide assembly protein A